MKTLKIDKENSHVFLFENEEGLVSKKRDLTRSQLSGVAVLKTPDNSLRITLLNYQTWPFVQHGFASLFTWERFKDDMELELKFFRLETERQKMLDLYKASITTLKKKLEEKEENKAKEAKKL